MARRSSSARALRRPPEARAAGSRLPIAAAAVVIILAALIAYANSYRGVFVFDDEPAIVENAFIRGPLRKAVNAPPGTTLSGRPIVSFSFAINHALAPSDARDVFMPPRLGDPPGQAYRFYTNVWGYHAGNLLIHICAALALFGIIRRTLTSATLRERFGDDATGLALASALIWVVHPLETGSVTYIVQRAESLMGLFYLLTLYCSIRGWEKPQARWVAGSAAACALGMASKEVMVTAPVVVVLWDWMCATTSGEEARWKFLRRRRWPLYTALASTWAILAALVSGGHRADAVGFGFAEWPWWRYLMTQIAVVTHYLRLAIVPRPLVLDYEWPPARSVAEIAIPGLLLVFLLTLSIWGLRRRHPAALAGVIFFLILAPTSSVLPIVTEVAAEHRMYLPLAPLVAFIVAIGFVVLTRSHPTAAVPAGVVLTLAIVGTFATMTRTRNADYHDYERIWVDTVQKRPRNARARHNYATALMARGEYARAEEQLRVAVEVDPRYAEAEGALGVALCGQDRCGEALPHLEKAAALAPDSSGTQANLGEAYAARGESAAAVRAFERALTLTPDDVRLLNRAGWLLATDPSDDVRSGVRALVHAQKAVELTGRRDVESLDTLAAAQAECGRFSEAVDAATEALRLAPAQEPAIVPELEQRLALYRSGRPFRQRPATR